MRLPKTKILEETWAVHCLILGLGFNADDIYISPSVLNPE